MLLVVPNVVGLCTLTLSGFVCFSGPSVGAASVLQRDRTFVGNGGVELFRLSLACFIICLVPIMLFFNIKVTTFGVCTKTAATSSSTLLCRTLLLMNLVLTTFTVFNVLAFVIRPEEGTTHTIFCSRILGRRGLVVN